MHEITRNPTLTSDQLNRLFELSWRDHEDRDFLLVLERSLAYLGAFSEDQLVGFVNVAWDGGRHGFILDVTVHPENRRMGIATDLLKGALAVARDHELEWLHVDFEPELEDLYRKAGYLPTAAGVLRVPSFDAG